MMTAIQSNRWWYSSLTNKFIRVVGCLEDGAGNIGWVLDHYYPNGRLAYKSYGRSLMELGAFEI